MRLLFLLPVALVALAGQARAEGLAFVINSRSASISVIDVATHREKLRIPVLREPHHMALTPDHRYLLVGDTTGNEVLFINPRTAKVERRLTIADPYQLVFSPDGRWLTIAGLARNQVDVYDAATMRLVKRFPLSAMPSHINYAPDSSVVYVSLQETGRLAAIDLRTLQVLWDSKVGDTPAGVLWLNGHILVGLMGSDCVAVVDPVDGHVVQCVHTGRGPHVLFLSHDRRTLYVTNRVGGTIVALDPATLQEIRRYQVSGGPDDMDFAPDGKLWISRRFDHSIGILDPVTGKMQVIEVGRSPHGIWLNTHDTLPVSVSQR
ncbi:MAG TPA: YncE family protein [Acetobacteraceae bacterium]|nr:YncE family protein [Acetobacteraceae bacterium]